ncbi:tRNA glutamyl-Q(34) synthetase GluQRS [Allosphingosinicella deserti]|uniref:tRNA glutamyl-Q(34) synthetase GluQRS n=1 Tax=Allosphingosinicella deserti TaxID=2116704 RepID=A0A2P7QV92_9SPHN|nr:tRNA glutamyl-Q(34) synthetase GluQRS [Sphingomonas deserti]PSJ41879.1 tRNA glutamyl-Q(34) synthetase GluQRS [Sphingomonas deserti]
MQIVSRFAPSPTGRLHLGHAYSALLAHDFARDRNGAFLLRIEDIDPGRVRSLFVDGIIEDLMWLGLDWDGEILFQSERLPFYAEALDGLKTRGLVYPCFCTRSEIAAEVAASASAPHGPDGPLYPGICRRLSRDERARRLAAEPHAWRLDTAKASAEAGPLYWHDEETEVLAEPQAFGDVVLARKDAPTSYHLAVTVDDAGQGVTDIVRGRDLYAATDVHRLLQALLELPTPHYHHHPLLTDAEGLRLAKRTGAPTLASLREAGADPARLIADLRMGQLPGGYSSAGT